ncbi:NAD(P)/FAD-dependent oxidoreductase [soil metagenome]|nr:NAD(P)/FAD-dependent oxidoreductase [Acidimicrobiia bacterium]
MTTTAPTPTTARDPAAVEHTRVAVVGTGFAGLGAAIALQRAGVEHVVLERAEDVGGTWRDNTYPGCRCDVPSHLYSFSFAPNPEWSETYSPQPEIQAYLRTTAERFGVLERVRFGADVRRAGWDAEAQRWRLDTAAGPMTSDVLILGNGPLAEPAIPDLPGLDTFAGTWFHSATWRSDHDLTGERVAVIGTGASAIQFVPQIQPLVGRITLFQRTPPWVLPHRNRVIRRAERAVYRRVPVAQKAVRGLVYWTRELFVTGLLRNAKSLDGMEKMARKQLETQVPDPELRARLTPEYRPGCKRLLLSNDYYPSLIKDNVEVLSEKIVEIRPHSIITADGTEHEVDTIIFGTGFHVTDNPVAERVVGTDGRTMAEHWEDTGAQAHLGTTVPGFPNLFLLAGPNTGIGHTSLVVMIEAQLRYIVDALRVMQDRGATSVDLRRPVLRAWTKEIQEKASKTVWNTGGCASWYLDKEGRNTALWPDHTFRFRRRTRRFDVANYELSAPTAPARRVA